MCLTAVPSLVAAAICIYIEFSDLALGIALIGLPISFVLMIVWSLLRGVESNREISRTFRGIAEKWKCDYFEELPEPLDVKFRGLRFLSHGTSRQASRVIRRDTSAGECNTFILTTTFQDHGGEGGAPDTRTIIAIVDHRSEGVELSLEPRVFDLVNFFAVVMVLMEKWIGILLRGGRAKPRRISISQSTANDVNTSAGDESPTIWLDQLSEAYTWQKKPTLSPEALMFLIENHGLTIQSTKQHLFVSKQGSYWALASKAKTEQHVKNITETAIQLAKLLQT